MSSDIIPQDVSRFILQNIDSVAQLEGLLLLRANLQELYNSETVAKRLYISEKEAGELLWLLTGRGFFSQDEKDPPHFRYDPQSPELEQMTAQVADAYSRYLVPVTKLIHSKPKNKIQQFADAFWIRKE